MFELVVAGCLIALNGLFALSELAIVSARKVRLRVMLDQGRAGAEAALELADNPGKFLSTVQIGITLIGILAGAVSGAALGERMTLWLMDFGLSRNVSEFAGYGLVIGFITYLSVIIGELVPKQFALKNAEGIACAVAPAMRLLSRAARPVVWLLDASTKAVFRLMGISPESESSVTDEEIKTIMAEAETAGVIETDERHMIAGVMRLADRMVRGVMTPRTEVEWLDITADEEALKRQIKATTHSRLPVGDGNPDNFIGVILLRDLVAASIDGAPLAIRRHVRRAPVIPDTLDALEALKVLREAEVPMALVHDEFGHFDGVVTPGDILDAIAGSFRSDADSAEPEAVRRDDGSWLLSGWMPVDEMAEQLGVPLPERRDYETVAGLVIGELRHLPETGEVVEAHGWRFEVVDMDGRRVDKVLASRIP